MILFVVICCNYDNLFVFQVARATEAVMGIALNPYNIIGECYRGGNSQSQRMTQFMATMAKHMSYQFTDKEVGL